MKNDFGGASAASPKETVLRFDLRWPYDDKDSMSPRSVRDGENTWRDVKLSDINAITFSTPSEKTFGQTPVYLIAEGQAPFMTFLTKEEETGLRTALATRDLFKADETVRASELRFFEAPKELYIDTSRIHRMFDGPEQHNDDLIFKIVFDNNSQLSISIRDPEFDSEAALAANPVTIRPDETPRQKWFREADEGTVIGNAMEARIKNQRAELAKFLDTVAEKAPQLYKIEGTKFALFTRPSDVNDIFIFTQQTDAARITFKKSEGENYGRPVDKTAYFSSPENAIWGAERLNQKIKAAQQKPKAANAGPAP